jgi:ribonucleoside-diphosphate reductase alpha chain
LTLVKRPGRLAAILGPRRSQCEPMIDRLQPSPFLSPESVTVWDTWFRWREHGRLRDVSIEATWQRVARAVSATERQDAARWKSRLFDAQARWQLLFDERILAAAGTGGDALPDDPVAVLNAAAFVGSPLTAAAAFDFDAFRGAAALAVRALDNILLPRLEDGSVAPDLRVGLLGVADALALLGKRYDGAAGRVMAAAIAQALAEGCAQASSCLAAQRGALAGWRLPPCASGFSDELRAVLARSGMRHRRLTAISSQPRLARLANNVTDALDPIDADGRRGNLRDGCSPSYAIALARATAGSDAATAMCAALPRVALPAQIDLRGAVQPWIDTPIDYPFRAAAGVDARSAVFWNRLANAHRLGEMTLAES